MALLQLASTDQRDYLRQHYVINNKTENLHFACLKDFSASSFTDPTRAPSTTSAADFGISFTRIKS